MHGPALYGLTKCVADIKQAIVYADGVSDPIDKSLGRANAVL